MQEKLCPKCKKTLPISEFTKDCSTKTGLRSHCKPCCAVYRKAYHLRDPQRHIRRVTEWKNRNYARSLSYLASYRNRLYAHVLDHYGAVCACCGETTREFLTIDHVGGGGMKHRRATGGTQGVCRDIIKNNFPAKYRILCMNCNWATRHGKPCPHKAKAGV